MIDTLLPGDPDSLEEMADWLLGSLRVVVEEAGEDAVLARRTSSGIWEGESGEAYREFTRSLVRASDETSSDVLSAEDAFRQCGVHLRAAQEVLEACRGKAVAGGLALIGPHIVAPEPAVDSDPAPRRASPRATEHWDEKQAAFGEQQRKVALYQRLAREASTARREYDEWCDDALAPAAREAGGDGASLVDSLLSTLEFLMPKVLNFQLSYPARKLSAQVRHLRDEAKIERARAKQIVVDRRSGDNSRRGPAKKTSPHEARRQAWLLEQLGEKYARSPVRHLPLLGSILSLGLSAKEISDGESPGKVVSSETAATAAGVAVVVFAPVSAPAVAVALGAVGVGAAVHGLSGVIWDHLPADVREDIDAGLEKSWEKGKEIGGDIVHGTADAFKSLGGLVS